MRAEEILTLEIYFISLACKLAIRVKTEKVRKLNQNNLPLNYLTTKRSTYLDDDADTVVTTTDVGYGYNDDALSLGSDVRRSSHASHGQTMEEVERATREMLTNAASSKV